MARRARRCTIAPSPPIIDEPEPRGMAVQSAVSISGAARSSVFWNENEVPNEPAVHLVEDVERVGPRQRDEHAEENERGGQGAQPG